MATKFHIYSIIRQILTTYRVRSNFKLASNDIEGWLNDINTTLQLGNLIGNATSTAIQLNATIQQGYTNEMLICAIRSGKLNRTQLQELWGLISRAGFHQDLDNALWFGDRLQNCDRIDALARNPKLALQQGASPCDPRTNQQWNRKLLMKTAKWESVLATADDYLKMCRQSISDDETLWLNKNVEFESEMELLDRGRNPFHEAIAMALGKSAKGHYLGNELGLSLCPSLGFQCEAILKEKTVRTMLQIAIALEIHKIDERYYPDSLQQLVPEYLPAVPKDSFHGEEFVYDSSGDTFKLYSLGINWKDDGGTIGKSKYNPDDELMPEERFKSWQEFLANQ